MKNTKKIVSLILAVCMIASLAISASAANTVDASGGTGTSSVTLSSTADGSIGGDPAATKMSVSRPDRSAHRCWHGWNSFYRDRREDRQQLALALSRSIP